MQEKYLIISKTEYVIFNITDVENTEIQNKEVEKGEVRIQQAEMYNTIQKYSCQKKTTLILNKTETIWLRKTSQSHSE